MKHLKLKKLLPLVLTLLGVFIIGSGCYGPADGQSNYWQDLDGDGFGTRNNPTIYDDDNVPAGWVDNNSDCNDTDISINPDALEIPDNDIDENCDDLFAYTFYKDGDGDGFGDPATEQIINVPLAGAVTEGDTTRIAGDCNDQDPDVNPKADEIEGNNIDDNCDGNVDIIERYIDADGDGYGSNDISPAEGVTNSYDCNDNNNEIHPYVIEIYDNGIDDNCDNVVD